MKAKTVGIAVGVVGAGLFGASTVAASKGKAMRERCKEACAHMAGKGSPPEGETHDSESSSEQDGTHHGCGPAACGK